MFGNIIWNKSDLINSIKSRTNNDVDTKVKYNAYKADLIKDDSSKDSNVVSKKHNEYIGRVSLSINDVNEWKQGRGMELSDTLFGTSLGKHITLTDNDRFLFNTGDGFDDFTVYLIKPMIRLGWGTIFQKIQKISSQTLRQKNVSSSSPESISLRYFQRVFKNTR